MRAKNRNVAHLDCQRTVITKGWTINKQYIKNFTNKTVARTQFYAIVYCISRKLFPYYNRENVLSDKYKLERLKLSGRQFDKFGNICGF